MSCDPEQVTGFVDAELDAAAAAAVAAHVEACPGCRAQAEEERALRARLAGLSTPELPAGLAGRVRAGVRREPRLASVLLRWALPVAATVVFAGWLRGYAPFVAWDLARDHQKCFSRQPLPAKVLSGEPAVVSAWFEERGTRLPALPATVGELRLVGARYCPLATLAMAPHVYYASGTGQVSLFVVPQRVRVGTGAAARARGASVRLLRLEGETAAIVASSDADAQAFERALRPLVASRGPGPGE